MSSRGKRFDSFDSPQAKGWRLKLYLISVHKDKEAEGSCGGSEDHLVSSLDVVFRKKNKKNPEIYTILPLQFK